MVYLSNEEGFRLLGLDKDEERNRLKSLSNLGNLLSIDTLIEIILFETSNTTQIRSKYAELESDSQ